MTAPTHGIFAGILLFAFGMPVEAAPYLIFGSLLPDIDHDRSFIGRILFPISYPLNKKFGHRNITHSLLVWLPLLVIGIKYKIAMWIAIGGLSHLFLDMWNLTGVGIFKPLTDKIFVMANKNFRIKVGSRNEFILMLVFSMMLWGAWELHKKKFTNLVLAVNNDDMMEAIGKNDFTFIETNIDKFKIENNLNDYLLLVSSKNSKEIVELLIKYGANIEAEDNYGAKPLLLASWNNSKEVAEL